MKRFASVLEIRAERIAEYKRLHRNVWPGVREMIQECNIHNFSIYLRQFPDGRYYLFSYFEYTGNDYDADAARLAADETTQKWWEACRPAQKPFDGLPQGQWWAEMEEVFRCE